MAMESQLVSSFSTTDSVRRSISFGLLSTDFSISSSSSDFRILQQTLVMTQKKVKDCRDT